MSLHLKSKGISEGIISGKQWPFPSTRYQGSKRKILPWIYENLKSLEFDTTLDLFGGTGVVSYLMKRMGKSVTYNDYLKFNFLIGMALIENSEITLTLDDTNFLLTKPRRPRLFIERTFDDFYYTREENRWLDNIINNIIQLSKIYKGEVLSYKRSLAFYAVFQSCLAKRPFNLFHRRNLYLRENEVSRTFGNKTTWDTPFEVLFRKFVAEVNSLVFSNGKTNKALNMNASDMNGNYDLVYIDPPYFSRSRSPAECDYRRLYHFLEGIANYENWAKMIDYDTYIYRLKQDSFHWTKTELLGCFEELFKRFRKSTLVVSYKSPGLPSVKSLYKLLERYKPVVELHRRKYLYALNKQNGKPGQNIEVLLIGRE